VAWTKEKKMPNRKAGGGGQGKQVLRGYRKKKKLSPEERKGVANIGDSPSNLRSQKKRGLPAKLPAEGEISGEEEGIEKMKGSSSYKKKML